MMIVGRAANNIYLGLEDELPPNEFICWNNEEVKNIKEKLKVKEKDVCHTNNASVTYHTEGKYYTIHDATKVAVFESFKRHAFTATKVTLAPLSFVYSWTRAKATYLSSNLEDWEDNIKTHSHIYETYMKDVPEKWHRRTDLWAKYLIFFGAMGYKQSYIPHQYKSYDLFTEDSLFDLFKFDRPSSLWQDSLLCLTSGKTQPSQSLWKCLSDENKLELIMERLYVDCANEFLIDELVEFDATTQDIVRLFKKAIMFRCSQPNNPWLTTYMLTHFKLIMSSFDEYFPDYLADAIQWNLLIRTKVNRIY